MQIKELQGQIYKAMKSISLFQLNQLILKVYSSPEFLNQSYRVYINKTADPSNHNMDIHALEVFYEDMANNSTGMHNGFQTALQVFFQAMPTFQEVERFVKEGEKAFDRLRFFLILIFCPMIYDEGYRPNFVKMTNLIHPLKPEQKECLARWLCSMSATQLEQIVKYIQRALSTQTVKLLPDNMDKNDPKSIAHFLDIFCSFLLILNRSNEIKRRLSIQVFRNPEMMKYFNPEQQYKFYKKKVEILNFIRFPFLFDIHYKLKLLEVENKDQQQTTMEEGMRHLLQVQFLNSHNHNQPIQLNTAAINSLFLQVKVHRNMILMDSMNELMHAQGLKNPIKVKFIDEPGDDLGGVKKEYFQLLVKEIFDPHMDMFLTKNNNKHHWFNGMSFESLQMFEFAGLVVGLSIYNGTMLDLKFPRLVYKKLLLKEGESLDQLEQLKEIDPDLYKSFKYILETNEPLQSMEVFFTAEVMQFDTKVVIPLRKMGDRIRVTQSNKEDYVREYSKWMVHKYIEAQFNAFKKGFCKVVTGNMIRILNAEELERIICGLEIVDLNELKKGVKYEGGYTEDTPLVRFLWEILEEFPLEKKKAFLFFSTGSDRAPIGGLSKVKFTIQRHGPDSQNVPSSHTCSNVLLLPQYTSKDRLRKKLLIALTHNEGFGLI